MDAARRFRRPSPGEPCSTWGAGRDRDAFVCAKLVGPAGRVIGVDMTDSQLAVARDCTTAQMQRFGFSESNVAFVHGYIEDLAAAGIADNSVDVVISNCVINLAPDKRRVFAEIWRVLKPGGELYFSDVFADRRIPRNPDRRSGAARRVSRWGRCTSRIFGGMLRALGCPDFRVVADTPVELKDEAIAAKIGMVQFRSLTVRAFKLADLGRLLRGLRPGGDLSRDHSRRAACVHPRRSSRVSNGPAGAGMRKYRRHGAGHPVGRTLRGQWGSLAAFRAVRVRRADFVPAGGGCTVLLARSDIDL
jgi:SAM-dependent methyltransferase